VAATQGYDVEIESAGPTFGLGVSFSNISVKSRPTKPGEKATRFTIESATASTSLFSLIGSALSSVFSSTPSPPAVTIALDAFGGHLEMSQEGTAGKKGDFALEITASDIDMSQVPGIREAINLPVAGTMKLDVDITSATGKLANAKGSISFLCAGCSLGDGKSAFKIAAIPFLAGGLTLPKVRLGDVTGEVAIENGTGKLKGFEGKSPDIELSMEGDVQLRDPAANSVLNTYLRFKPSDAFLKTAGTLQTLLQVAGSSGRRPDGSYGVRLGGRLGAPAGALSAVSPLGAGGAPPAGGARPPGIAPTTYTPPPPQHVEAPPPPPSPPIDVPQQQPPPPPPDQQPPPQVMPPPPMNPPPQPVEADGTLRGTPPPPVDQQMQQQEPPPPPPPPPQQGDDQQQQQPVVQ
jgi:type II secretion system protein N